MDTHPIKRFMEETGTDIGVIATWCDVSVFRVLEWISGDAMPRDRAVRLSKSSSGRIPILPLMFPKGLPPGVTVGDADDDPKPAA